MSQVRQEGGHFVTSYHCRLCTCGWVAGVCEGEGREVYRCGRGERKKGNYKVILGISSTTVMNAIINMSKCVYVCV